MINMFKANMKSSFTMKDLWEISHFFGIDFKRENGVIKMNQKGVYPENTNKIWYVWLQTYNNSIWEKVWEFENVSDNEYCMLTK